MLEVRQQAHLGGKRLLEICFDSISYRLLRSMVTVCIILLAIAFLAVIMVEGYLGRAVRDTVKKRTSRMTAYTHFLSKASRVDADEKLIARFGALKPGTADHHNFVAWGAFTPEQAEQAIATFKQVESYLGFFDKMAIGRRVLLVDRFTGVEIFDWLNRSENLDVFNVRIKELRTLQVPGGLAGFQKFLTEWPDVRARLDVVKARYADTVKAVAEYCGAKGISGRLKEAVQQKETKAFFIALTEHGLRVDAERVEAIVEGIDYYETQAWALAQLKKNPIRTGWNRQWSKKFSPGDALLACSRSDGVITWVEDKLREGKVQEGFDRGRFTAFCHEYARRKQLLDDDAALVERYGETRDLGAKTIWLISVSFLVCVVGIANAMLMSVLERFKEIATMKCLGARNETIAFLFVVESVIIGMVGGLVGILLGYLIVFLRLTLHYGGLVYENLPGGDLVTAFVVCFCCSMLLATLAAIYPAWVASRMAPMEAMRVD